jgi:GntR family transcriptional regulator
MALDIHISPGVPTPIYRQIIDQIRRRVALGINSPGDQLPSVRTLAEQLVINPNTVAKAYAELVHDGLVESRQGRGYFIADTRQVFSKQERQRRLEAALGTLLSEAFALQFDPEEIRQALNKQLARFMNSQKPDKG